MTNESSLLTYELLMMLTLSSNRLLRRGVQVTVGRALGHAVHLLRWPVPEAEGALRFTQARANTDAVLATQADFCVHRVIPEVTLRASVLGGDHLHHLLKGGGTEKLLAKSASQDRTEEDICPRRQQQQQKTKTRSRAGVGARLCPGS